MQEGLRCKKCITESRGGAEEEKKKRRRWKIFCISSSREMLQWRRRWLRKITSKQSEEEKEITQEKISFLHHQVVILFLCGAQGALSLSLIQYYFVSPALWCQLFWSVYFSSLRTEEHINLYLLQAESKTTSCDQMIKLIHLEKHPKKSLLTPETEGGEKKINLALCPLFTEPFPKPTLVL